MPRPARLIFALATLLPAATAAQDVEWLAERYGTQVPEAYLRLRAADPTAFRFQRAWGGRGLDLRSFDGASAGGPALALGPRGEPVVGTFEIPVLLGLYANSGATAPFARAAIQDAYFDAGAGTITEYYAEVSSDSVSLLGAVQDWVRTARPDTAYTVGESGLVSGPLGGGGAGNFVYEVVSLVDQRGGVDWGRYDNDGPDGLPNSGDDDGYVDILAVIHPTRGGECGGTGGDDRIWSHYWTLSSAVSTPYTTSTRRSGGTGFIRVDDYTIQASLGCSGGGLAPIGIFAHEIGHAFGLPDLYDTCNGGASCPNDGARTSGTGHWDLMGDGAWGCNGASPAMPCHPSAWSKAALGWADVVTLPPDADLGTLTLPPVESTGTVFRVDARDGSGEYFLLENRQRVGYDQNLPMPGLLVWQIDPDWIAPRWPQNRVNANAHLGVWLRQADGRDDLSLGRGRGDAGDPFPGTTGNTAFHAATNPGAVSFDGGVTGLTVLDVQPSGVDDVSFRLLTRYTTVAVRADGAASNTGLFTVDGQQVDPPETTFQSAPFVAHRIEAVSGEDLGPGARRPFREWQDDPAAPRVRPVVTPLVDTEYVAVYAGTQYELALTSSGGVNGVTPATYSSNPPSPDSWYDDGAAVTLEALPRTGFSFLGWSGALAGQGNPASFTMSGPLSAGADFELIYDVADAAVEIPGATRVEVQLAVENGTEPVTWTLVGGELPWGVSLGPRGLISGASLDLGAFPITVQAVDGIGLPATGTVSLNVVAPSIPIDQLASPFLLAGPTLSDDQINFLNRQGNRVGAYDVGDFRAWVLANPTLPLSAALGDGVHRRTLTLRRSASEAGERR